MEWIELDEGAQALRPEHPFHAARAWRGPDIAPAHWTVEVPQTALHEADAVIELLRRQQLPVCMLSTQMFQLDACRAMMARIRERLDKGIGIALLDRLPVERWSAYETQALYWLLGQLLSRPVAQEWSGLVFRDIHDDGGGQSHGNERAVTNRALSFHTDNSGNRTRPEFVGLLALGAPLTGGESRYCTLYSVYNTLAREAPQLLERLFEPFLHDRQGIQAPGEPEVLRAPALTWDGVRLWGRFSLNKITGGYHKAGVQMDDLTRRALAAVVSCIDHHRLACTFTIEPGQLQFLNNLEGLHHRCDYVDGTQPGQRRHLVRMWYRDHGRPFFDG